MRHLSEIRAAKQIRGSATCKYQHLHWYKRAWLMLIAGVKGPHCKQEEELVIIPAGTSHQSPFHLARQLGGGKGVGKALSARIQGGICRSDEKCVKPLADRIPASIPLVPHCSPSSQHSWSWLRPSPPPPSRTYLALVHIPRTSSATDLAQVSSTTYTHFPNWQAAFCLLKCTEEVGPVPLLSRFLRCAPQEQLQAAWPSLWLQLLLEQQRPYLTILD